MALPAWQQAGGKVTAPTLDKFNLFGNTRSNVDKIIDLKNKRKDIEDQNAFMTARDKARELANAKRQKERLDQQMAIQNANMGYKIGRDISTDGQWQKTFDANQADRDRLYNLKMAQIAAAKSARADAKAQKANENKIAADLAKNIGTGYKTVYKDQQQNAVDVNQTYDDPKYKKMSDESASSVADKGSKFTEMYNRLPKNIQDAYNSGGVSAVEKIASNDSTLGGFGVGLNLEQQVAYNNIDKVKQMDKYMQSINATQAATDTNLGSLTKKVTPKPVKTKDFAGTYENQQNEAQRLSGLYSQMVATGNKPAIAVVKSELNTLYKEMKDTEAVMTKQQKAEADRQGDIAKNALLDKKTKKEIEKAVAIYKQKKDVDKKYK